MTAAYQTLERAASVEQRQQTESIWHEMRERLGGFIARRVPADDAEDILQDVFLRIHKGLGGLRDSQSVTAWTYQIARNAITDYHRKRAAAGRAIAAVAQDVQEADEPDDEAIVAQAVNEFSRCMTPMMGELPDHYRQAFELT